MDTQAQKDQGSLWTVTGLFLSGLVGAGFATGREIFVYFASYGTVGILGFLLSCGMLFAAAVRILSVVIPGRMTRVHELPCFIARKPIARVFTGSIVLFSFCGYVTMLAGFRDVAGQLFPLAARDHIFLFGLCTCGIATAFALLVLNCGFRVFASLCKIVTPILILGIALAAIIAACKGPGEPLKVIVPKAPISALILRTLVYTGYNLLFLVGVLGRAGTLSADKKTVRCGSLAGAGLFLLGGTGIFIALGCMEQTLAQSEMPLCAVLLTLGPVPGTLFSSLLALAMLLCAVSALGATVSVAGKKHFTAPLLALLAIPLSYTGFDTILSLIYPVFGLVGIFLLGILAQTRGKNV